MSSAKKMFDVEIISVSYNSYNAFMSNKWIDILSSEDIKVSIIDNNSPDGSGRKLCNKFGNIDVKIMQQNIGYGRALNVGLNKTNKKYVFIVNPDVSFSIEDVERMVEIARNDCRSTCIWAPVYEKNDNIKDVIESVSLVSGAAMLFEIEKFTSFFDENIFLFFEETDLCKRVINNGGKIKLCHSVAFDHKFGKSSGDDFDIECIKAWHYAWSRCYFMKKHNLFNCYDNIFKMYLEYKIQSLINTNNTKRMLYNVKSKGVKDFFYGKKAFNVDGSPYNIK